MRSVGVKRGLSVVGLLGVVTMVFGLSSGAGAAPRGCVEELLRPPHEGALGTYIEHPGRKPDAGGSGGQELVIHIQYRAVSGCEKYGRTSEIKLEMKQRGESSWSTPPPLRFWDHVTQGVSARSREGFEGGLGIPYEPYLPSSCVDGARPRYRVAIKTAAKLIGSKKTLGTSPITYLPVAYKPAGAAHC